MRGKYFYSLMFHYECDHTSPTPTKLTQFGLSTSGHTQSKGAVLHAIFPWQLSSSTKPKASIIYFQRSNG